VLSSALRACGNHSGEAERSYGIGLKLFGFIPEPVFTFIPESCSRSSRNTVRNHPGIPFTLPRIPHDVQYVTVSLLDYKPAGTGSEFRVSWVWDWPNGNSDFPIGVRRVLFI
jgi:hypothetical protein